MFDSRNNNMFDNNNNNECKLFYYKGTRNNQPVSSTGNVSSTPVLENLPVDGTG
jgi:hypothetical protein